MAGVSVMGVGVRGEGGCVVLSGVRGVMVVMERGAGVQIKLRKNQRACVYLLTVCR